MKAEMKKELVGSLVWAGIMLVVASGAVFAQKLGYIEHDTTTRLTSGAIGLWMVWYGNLMPKTLVPVPACAGHARRIASWSMVLSGLVYAGVWAFAPIPVAVWAGTGAVFAGFAVTLGYCLSLRNKGKAA